MGPGLHWAGMGFSGMGWNGIMEWNGVEWILVEDALWSFWVVLGRFAQFWSFLGQKNVIFFSRSLRSGQKPEIRKIRRNFFVDTFIHEISR